jgi:hypothetical protein
VVKALVEATAFSRPALIYTPRPVLRAMRDPTPREWNIKDVKIMKMRRTKPTGKGKQDKTRQEQTVDRKGEEEKVWRKNRNQDLLFIPDMI